jgi:Disulphide bond corrector protein DsbC
MKRFIICVFVIMLALAAEAQLNPVSWIFTTTKKGDKIYEIHMKAIIQSGWHMYSQTQPGDAIAIPTGFTLNSNPLLALDGKIKEIGSVEKFHDAKLGISANQFSNSVDFIQMVKLKAKVKTNMTGSVEYQTCNDQKCLPPKTVNFSIAIQ